MFRLRRAAGATVVGIRWLPIAIRPEGRSRSCIAGQAPSQRHYGDHRFPMVGSLTLNPIQGRRPAIVSTLLAGQRTLVADYYRAAQAVVVRCFLSRGSAALRPRIVATVASDAPNLQLADDQFAMCSRVASVC